MNYAEIKQYDVANGTGVRVSIFVSGCTHHCKHCFNEETWDFNYGRPFSETEADQIVEYLKPDYVAGLSVLGGEPFEPSNQEGLLPLLQAVKKEYPEKDIWCYSGYLYDADMQKGGKVYTDVTEDMLSCIDVLVDGEFVEEREPTHVVADLVVGSLIKNPGGGLAPTGAYIAGRRDLVEGAAMRLTCPGIGRECGATLGNNRLLYQGLFLAPHTVAQAVKTAVFAARIMELLGYEAQPRSDEPRHDIIQMIHLGGPEAVKRFCKGIQSGAPVDSYVTPEPWDMPGYDCPVIMAAGAFIQGASIELSADAPMREPYTVYLQGGLTYESGKAGVLLAAEELLRGRE